MSNVCKDDEMECGDLVGNQEAFADLWAKKPLANVRSVQPGKLSFRSFGATRLQTFVRFLETSSFRATSQTFVPGWLQGSFPFAYNRRNQPLTYVQGPTRDDNKQMRSNTHQFSTKWHSSVTMNATRS